MSLYGAGKVHTIRDDLVTVVGLSQVGMGCVLITKSNTKLLVTAIHATHIIAIAFQNPIQIQDKLNDNVYFLTTNIGILTHFDYFNKIINPLGVSLLNLNRVGNSRVHKAVDQILKGFDVPASIANRMPVCESVQTGVKIIDLVIPIGRGQRELIIGDRKTGKTQITVDTILNQRRNNQLLTLDGQMIKRLFCIYIGIGQRASSIKQLAIRLAKKNAMYYSIVISASAGSATLLQYIAPYIGTAIAEFFRNGGLHTLVIYDDLTKHAQAYRQIALLSGTVPGREAFPGDIFYVHASLLERSSKMNKQFNSGSVTSLPIVETFNNDLTGYIPTNVISITDGQIYLDSPSFNKGLRPAIYLQTSVSRVGSKAQSVGLAQLSKPIKHLIQIYNNLDVLYKTGELNQFSKLQYIRGRSCFNLIQQFHSLPLTLENQIISIYLAIYGFGDLIELESEISLFYRYYLENLKQIPLINRHLLNIQNISQINNLYNYLHHILYSLIIIKNVTLSICYNMFYYPPINRNITTNIILHNILP